MAFSYTIRNRTVVGDKTMLFGTFTNSGTTANTGGTITTNMSSVLHADFTITGEATADKYPVVISQTTANLNPTFKIVTVAGVSGTFTVLGND